MVNSLYSECPICKDEKVEFYGQYHVCGGCGWHDCKFDTKLMSISQLHRLKFLFEIEAKRFEVEIAERKKVLAQQVDETQKAENLADSLANSRRVESLNKRLKAQRLAIWQSKENLL